MSLHITLDALKQVRENHVAFELAKSKLERFLQNENDEPQPWLFPQVLAITRERLTKCLQLEITDPSNLQTEIRKHLNLS